MKRILKLVFDWNEEDWACVIESIRERKKTINPGTCAPNGPEVQGRAIALICRDYLDTIRREAANPEGKS